MARIEAPLGIISKDPQPMDQETRNPGARQKVINPIDLYRIPLLIVIISFPFERKEINASLA